MIAADGFGAGKEAAWAEKEAGWAEKEAGWAEKEAGWEGKEAGWMLRLVGREGAGNGTGGWNASEPKFMLKNKNPYTSRNYILKMVWKEISW